MSSCNWKRKLWYPALYYTGTMSIGSQCYHYGVTLSGYQRCKSSLLGQSPVPDSLLGGVGVEDMANTGQLLGKKWPLSGSFSLLHAMDCLTLGGSSFIFYLQRIWGHEKGPKLLSCWVPLFQQFKLPCDCCPLLTWGGLPGSLIRAERWGVHQALD